eukprot:TRINITY_DN5106_c0_g1_i12.p2 TRINITY_DN5106_c0_g1~~TRINITY_DN5106_c0_g1_i12.p2  ORF type:complete len:601 (+),score=174.33 TRINITY_DN5106_c0_g1_i12:2892-4694(+)
MVEKLYHILHRFLCKTCGMQQYKKEDLSRLYNDCIREKEDLTAVRNYISQFPEQLNQVVYESRELYFRFFKSPLGSLLHFACIFNRASIVNYLLTQENIDTDKLFEGYGYGDWKKYDKKKPLEIAQINKNEKIIKLFEERSKKSITSQTNIISTSTPNVVQSPSTQTQNTVKGYAPPIVVNEKVVEPSIQKVVQSPSTQTQNTVKGYAPPIVVNEKVVEPSIQKVVQSPSTQTQNTEKGYASPIVVNEKVVEPSIQKNQNTPQIPSNLNQNSTTLPIQNNIPQEQNSTNITPSQKPLSKWSSSEVFEYLKEHETLSPFAKIMKEEEISGEGLITLTTDELKSIGFKLGHIKSLQIVIKQLTEKVIPLSNNVRIVRGGNRFGDGLDKLTISTIQFYEKDYQPTKSIATVILEEGATGKQSLESAKQLPFASHCLSLEESALIYLYTVESPFYKQLNRIMREGTNEERKQYKDVIFYLDQAISKLRKNESKDVYRGINLVNPDYTPGKTINWPAFSSTTTDPKVAIEFMGSSKVEGTFFIIRTKSAVPIDQFSASSQEMECLLGSNSRFKIVSKASEGTKKILQEVLKCNLSGILLLDLEEV